LEALVDRTALVVGRVISIAEDTPDIARAFLARALTHRVVTSTFYTPRLEVAKVRSVSIALTIGTLRDISRVPGRFEPNFSLLQEFNVEDALVWDRQKVDEKHGERLFSEVVFNIPNVGDFVPQVGYFSFYVLWI
jgi:hypothetical protein